MKKIILLLSTVISLLFINTSIVSACSCSQVASLEESLEKATAVFSGKAIDVDTSHGTFSSSADPVKITFQVLETWKGDNYKILSVTTAREGATCGYPFKKNKEYLVYASGEKGELEASSCSRVKLLADAQAQHDLQALGNGNLPTNHEYPKNFNLTIVALIVSIIILIVVAILVIRKYKRQDNEGN